MLKLAVIFALALGCHGVYIPSEKLENAQIEIDEEKSLLTSGFLLYRQRENPVHPVLVTSQNTATLFTVNKKTIILIHGHGGSFSSGFSEQVRLAILANEDAYVIAMDWQVLASQPYSQVMQNIGSVGNDLREFIIMISNGVNPITVDNIQIVGFNLGAHVAGIGARGIGVARITGLDPSGDGWGSNPLRLNIQDAGYVEVIHTDGGRRGNGIGESLGTVDFFANGGNDQPGCITHSCSHNRAYELYAASMYKQLTGNRCESSTQINLNRCRGSPLPMGGTDSSKSGFGMYRVNTGRPPFY